MSASSSTGDDALATRVQRLQALVETHATYVDVSLHAIERQQQAVERHEQEIVRLRQVVDIALFALSADIGEDERRLCFESMLTRLKMPALEADFAALLASDVREAQADRLAQLLARARAY